MGLLLAEMPINLWDSFVTLFSGMGPVTAILYGLGLILIVIEISQQGFGLFGLVGAALVLLGVVTRLSAPDSNLAHLFWMVLIAMLVLVAAFLIVARLLRMGWIVRAAGLHPDMKMEQLENKTGLALTDLTPSGKVQIDGKAYDAVTLGDEAIDADSIVVPIAVCDDFIVVDLK